MKTVDVEAEVQREAPAQAVGMSPKGTAHAGIGGLGLLVLSLVLPVNIYVSVVLTLLGGGVLLVTALLAPRDPRLLLVPHAGVAVLLVLQGVGLCRQSCGGFGVYDHLLGMSTVAVGILTHLAALGVVSYAVLTRGEWSLALRITCSVLQGVSAFFLVRMILGQHWCPACVASHLLMAAQAIVLVRLTPQPHLRRFIVAMAAVGFLGINFLYHHTAPAVVLEPGDRLLGLVRTAQEEGTFAPVEVQAQAATVPARPLSPTRRSAASAPQAPAEKSLGVAGAAAGKAPAPAKAGASAGDVQTVALLAAATPQRTADFTCWGKGPREVIASMSLVCNGCREHWSRHQVMADAVKQGKARIRFLLTWPLQPEPHHGARLASLVCYAAGMLGEDELLVAMDRFFSADGLVFMNKVNAQLLGASNHGSIPVEVEREALVATIDFLDGTLDTARLAGVFSTQKPRIDAYLAEQVTWLLSHGDLRTPHYYFVADRSASTYLDTADLDPEVWSAFINKGP